MTNPLLDAWDTPFRVPPFGKITAADFAPALDIAMQDDLAKIDAIAQNPEPATFANTIEALETTSELMHKVLSPFYAMAGAHTNPALDALMREFSPRLAAHGAKISGNKALFQRIETLWNSRDTLGLSEEQLMLLKDQYLGFVRSGAALTGKAEARLTEIKSRLSVLCTTFTQNVLADERDWFMELLEDDLEGLPDFLIEAARNAGKEKGVNGPVITTSRSLITPFLQFSARRDLREIAKRAWDARGANGGEHDNLAIAQEILTLRQERAELLGYKNFAEFKLETEMAKAPDNVRDLLMNVWEPAKSAAERDAKILSSMLHADGINDALQTWDWRYYAEQRRKAEFDLDEAEIKPYFELSNMINASFHVAGRLFGLKFEPIELDLYHPDCKSWRVTRDDADVAVFIGDYFARGSKRSGAWCSAMRSQTNYPSPEIPIVVNVCNFAKGDPCLLSTDDVRTLFHEFGHALHQMLSNVTYRSLSGTSVARDFVELPSQLYEHWAMLPEILKQFARHVDTDESISDALIERIGQAATYDMGFSTVEYLASAIVDLEYHTNVPNDDIMAAQSRVLDQIGMPREITMRHATPHFAHVFAGDGYSAGYYSYMWSEVMDADAFAAFEEIENPFDADLARKLENTVLSKGGSVEPDVLYTQFRGRMPGINALLQGRGLAT
ncbi:MAG: M3 family peptidase [Rhodobacteraceae bacterium]|nr:M3 family peptidase [Paracoccaceae bacterium]